MHFIENSIATISSVGWGIFLPLLVIATIVIIIKYFGKIKGITTEKSSINPKDIIGPAAISMGAMIGTGAIIGVLGSMSSVFTSGQMYFEAIAGWALLAAILLLPLSYIETLVCKTTGMTPKGYVGKFVSPKLAVVYAFCFVTLYVFGFGGFQIQGINTAITIVAENMLNITLSPLVRFLFIVTPLLIFVFAIVLAKKHDVFISAMASMISIAVIMYLVFVILFIYNTLDYVPVFIDNVITGMKNPVTAGIGIPIGLTVAIQRIIQTSEPGLGALGMASLDSDSKPRAAGLISLIPACTTVFIAIFVTSYITSYGMHQNIIDLNGDSLMLLQGFFLTGYDVVGAYGLFTVILFTLLSGLTSLLGSYYFLNLLLDYSEDTNIKLYIVLVTTAGFLAVFGASIIFEMVDLLLFVVTAVNVLGIAAFVHKNYKDYLIK